MTDPLLALQSIRRFHSDEASRARFNNMPAAVRMHEHLLGRVDLVIAALATPAPAQPENEAERLKDILRATGYLTNSQAWECAEAILAAAPKEKP